MRRKRASDRGLSALPARAAALERLAATKSAPLDVLVVGGGITGAGVALDAAARGMSVGLVERSDFAAGTSGKSGKLVHGGLRYLEQREFGLVREAATERDLLRRLAPHLVQPVPFVLPVTDRRVRAKFGAGLWAYDALASFRSFHVHKYLDADGARRLLPVLPRGKARGGFVFYDCKTDDVRLVMEILIAAARRGATVVNHAAVTGLSSGHAGCSADVRDEVTGAEFEIRARQIVAAAGVWTDAVERLAHPDAPVRIRPSKGIHLVFARTDLPIADAAALIPDKARRRMLYVVPWLDSVLVGTTDTDHDGAIDEPTVDSDERNYCLEALNATFETSLSAQHVLGAYAGFRPLRVSMSGATADLSRRHVVYAIDHGIVGITGGKLTTWRRMAADAVDVVAGALGCSTKSTTRLVRLGSSDVGALQSAVARRAKRLSLTAETAEHLVRSYGDRALAVLDVAERGLVDRLVEGHPGIAAEGEYACEHEMVVHLSDFLTRRVRLAITDRDAGVGPRARAGEVVASTLGWNHKHLRTEVELHRRAVERERGLPAEAASSIR